ncbi:FAD dependent oxidoreductase [Penicillium canariense]|uniref:FAD dependent oxidoreductase n=1 Tax=Penicillium canariense TaxID=189055 RepID=A0A9W9HXP4_9EURO|nr:FAD dependent oxidoreductase [Penicillium canariense]KAJ5159718.1 FAD dependent oxidoreductase [Penicillium canariense]
MAHRNASALYSKAQAELSSSSSLLLKSEVPYADRGENEGIRLIVRTPKGNKLILAKNPGRAGRIRPQMDGRGQTDALSEASRHKGSTPSTTGKP